MLVIELDVENYTNKAKHNRPQKAWAGLAYARLCLRRYVSGLSMANRYS